MLGMVMGTPSSSRMMVLSGSMDSTLPVTTLLPPLISVTRSPTTKGCVRNCAPGDSVHQHHINARQSARLTACCTSPCNPFAVQRHCAMAGQCWGIEYAVCNLNR